MPRWETFSHDQARLDWDQTLVRFDDCSPFQAYAWGEYRRGLGWEPYHFVAFDDRNEVVAMMQSYVRRYPLSVGLVWSEGGPVGDLSVCDESLQQAIASATRLKRIYCRFRCDRQRDINDVLRLSGQGWSLPWYPLTSGYSMLLDLTQDEDRLLAACERNWRRNLSRSKDCNLTTEEWADPDVDEILSVFESMQKVKGLDEQHSVTELAQLLRTVNDQIVIYRCRDESGQTVSVGGTLVVGHRANSWLAATTERGRQLHASYAIYWALIQHCKKIGIRSFDLAGIDPVRNPGVFRFKRGTGATAVELLGEWDWASRPWLRWLGNWAIAHRERIKTASSKRATKAEAPLEVATPKVREGIPPSKFQEEVVKVA
jgi:peptidoglycan biosynthesis/recognition FemAB-like protein